jgi:hypothetical protein
MSVTQEEVRILKEIYLALDSEVERIGSDFGGVYEKIFSGMPRQSIKPYQKKVH